MSIVALFETNTSTLSSTFSSTLLILGSQYPVFYTAGQVALWMVVLFAVWSAVDYFRTFWAKVDGRFKAQERRRHTSTKNRQRRNAPTQ